MKLYDAHSHLHFPENADSFSAFLQSGVTACDCSAGISDMDDLREAAAACGGRLLASYGIHPWFVPSGARRFPADAVMEFLEGADAVGEIGLDRKCGSDYASQKSFFEFQLGAASDLGLPAVIHCRGAWGDLLEILGKCAPARGVLIHAAKCPPDALKTLSEMGAYFSFGMRELGSMKGLACAASAPADRILAESDGGADPGDLERVVGVLAELRNESAENMSKILEDNFLRLFSGGRRQVFQD